MQAHPTPALDAESITKIALAPPYIAEALSTFKKEQQQEIHNRSVQFIQEQLLQKGKPMAMECLVLLAVKWNMNEWTGATG